MLQLIPAVGDDLSLVKDMAAEIWPVTYGHIITQAQMEYMLAKFYDIEQLKAQLSASRRVLLIMSAGVHVGFIDIENRQVDQFIHKFYLKTDVQGGGLGSAAMQQLYSLENKGALPLRLQVNRQNFKAINFYFKNGFMIEAVLDLDIGNDFYMNDFLMVKHF